MSDHTSKQEVSTELESLENLIEINDPEIDPQALMIEIRERIAARRQELGYVDRSFPSFGDAISIPEPPHDMPYSTQLYDHLRQANLLYDEVETEPVLADSAALRIPILGRLWRLVRGQAHNLVLYYTNRSLAHQVTVNRHLVSVLNQLVAQNEALQRTVAHLQNQDPEDPGQANEV